MKGVGNVVVDRVLRIIKICKAVKRASNKLKNPNVRKNVVLSRHLSLTKIRSWTEVKFYMHLGLERKDFFYLLERVDKKFEHINRIMAERAYGSEICTELRLAITLRILRGAKYLDIEWYEISTWHVWDRTVIPMLKAINQVLKFNLHLDCTKKDELQKLEEQWNYVQIKKYGAILTKGIVAAGDGWLCKTYKPYKSLNLCAADYYNRKHTYGYIIQCFCDAWCRFVFFDCSFAGATNDISAYYCTAFYQVVSELMSQEFCVALDDAYSSISDGKHLTPFSNGQLLAAQIANPILYEMMRVYNQIFCSQRITIERALGQLVRKFGIFWTPIVFNSYNRF